MKGLSSLWRGPPERGTSAHCYSRPYLGGGRRRRTTRKRWGAEKKFLRLRKTNFISLSLSTPRSFPLVAPTFCLLSRCNFQFYRPRFARLSLPIRRGRFWPPRKRKRIINRTVSTPFWSREFPLSGEEKCVWQQHHSLVNSRKRRSVWAFCQPIFSSSSSI